jgi:arabinosaccharide transport system substrate-binding protein
MRFPLGTAPLCLLLIGIAAGVALLGLRALRHQETRRYDLEFVTFAEPHYQDYLKVIKRPTDPAILANPARRRTFEEQHGVTVNVRLVDGRALQSRLQAAMLAGTQVPDVLEIEAQNMGYFTKGPLADVGFTDLTDRIAAEHLAERMVATRFAQLSSRGRTFALPHDVHPVTLAYRPSRLAAAGIRVEDLKTWDDFVRLGRTVVTDTTGDGNPDRFMLDLPENGGHALEILLHQKGGGFIKVDGSLGITDDHAVDVVCWLVEHSVAGGPERIGYPAGWGTAMFQSFKDGLVLFLWCPDWFSKWLEAEVGGLAGDVRMIPLPAWTPGGPRTSSWGGTGICITRASPRQDLAWRLVEFLYLQPEDLSARYANTNILPPVKAAWQDPVFDRPVAFWSGQAIGRLYADLAPETPPVHLTTATRMAKDSTTQVIGSAKQYYADRLDRLPRRDDPGWAAAHQAARQDLRAFVTEELGKRAILIERRMARDRLLTEAAR